MTKLERGLFLGPPLGLLLFELGWFIWDRRGELLDRTIRILDVRRD